MPVCPPQMDMISPLVRILDYKKISYQMFPELCQWDITFSLEDGYAEDNLGYIPVKAGIKVFPVQRFYISGELGAAFGTDNGSKTSFVYAPGIGVGTNTGIDIGLRYEGMTGDVSRLGLKNPGQVALRIAYGFSL